jgi:alpha-glucosidase
MRARTASARTEDGDLDHYLFAEPTDAVRHDVPMSAFHFGPGYSSRGKRRYVCTWNREKVVG